MMCQHHSIYGYGAMRTTLDIDDDLLRAAKEMARREKKSAGQVVSELIRRALTERAPDVGRQTRADALEARAAAYGLRPLRRGGKVVTNEDIDRIRDDLGI